ncbi:unnamed protein product [marine sediment metagenome]|uniref:Uncharacterized protein n=1 Tax=marine sediment metagenome TaxID=412755 RepID=X0ZVJ6_9ZZZZ
MSRKRSRGISEHETRKRLIDKKLEHAGWGRITDFDENKVYTDETVIEYWTAKGNKSRFLISTIIRGSFFCGDL